MGERERMRQERKTRENKEMREREDRERRERGEEWRERTRKGGREEGVYICFPVTYQLLRKVPSMCCPFRGREWLPTAHDGRVGGFLFLIIV